MPAHASHIAAAAPNRRHGRCPWPAASPNRSCPKRASPRSARGALRPMRPMRPAACRCRSRPMAASRALFSCPVRRSTPIRRCHGSGRNPACRCASAWWPSQPGRVGASVRARGGEAPVRKAVEHVMQAPGVGVVEQGAHARIGQRRTLWRFLQLAQLRRAAVSAGLGLQPRQQPGKLRACGFFEVAAFFPSPLWGEGANMKNSHTLWLPVTRAPSNIGAVVNAPRYSRRLIGTCVQLRSSRPSIQAPTACRRRPRTRALPAWPRTGKPRNSPRTRVASDPRSGRL